MNSVLIFVYDIYKNNALSFWDFYFYYAIIMLMKAKLRRLKYKFRHDFLTVENVVLIIAIVLCLVWTYQSVVAMSRNWELSEKLSAKMKELELATLEVETAELQNQYYASEEYQELLARKNLDKQLPGEHLVVMPENSEAAKNKHKETEETKVESRKSDQSNFEKWMMYLFPKY